jgi:hypothetical protein
MRHVDFLNPRRLGLAYFHTMTQLTTAPSSKNLGNTDRWLRVVAAAAMVSCAFKAPLPATLRLSIFGGLAAYMLLTAVAGTCLGYKLMGRSTCPVSERK